MAKESSGLYHWTIITRILKFTLSCTTPPHPHFPRPQRKKIKYSVEVNRLSRLGFCLCLQPSFSPHSMDPQLHLQELLCFPNTTYSGPCLCASLSMELEHPDLPVPSLIRFLLTCRFNPATSPEESQGTLTRPAPSTPSLNVHQSLYHGSHVKWRFPIRP